MWASQLKKKNYLTWFKPAPGPIIVLCILTLSACGKLTSHLFASSFKPTVPFFTKEIFNIVQKIAGVIVIIVVLTCDFLPKGSRL